MTKAYETILVEQDERVGTITLNRPTALNALNSQVMHEVTTAAAEFDNDPGIGAIIITGSAKAFAAGADIKEMSHLAFSDVFAADFFAPWAKLAAVRTPTIAAVAGHALGGGCELAMMCDVATQWRERGWCSMLPVVSAGAFGFVQIKCDRF
jgi:enoyl-CoA hydratase